MDPNQYNYQRFLLYFIQNYQHKVFKILNFRHRWQT